MHTVDTTALGDYSKVEKVKRILNEIPPAVGPTTHQHTPAT